jgi:hypothetical protein
MEFSEGKINGGGVVFSGTDHELYNLLKDSIKGRRVTQIPVISIGGFLFKVPLINTTDFTLMTSTEHTQITNLILKLVVI